MNSNNGKPRSSYLPQQANVYKVDEVVDVNDIVDTLLTHQAAVDVDDDKGNKTVGDGLLAYMASHISMAGDIHKVMAMKTRYLIRERLVQVQVVKC
jgi:hypothetical protein